MITTIDTEKRMHQTIYSYLSNNVWNTPLLECRRNIVPMSYNKGKAAVNTVDLGCQSVDLPYRDRIEKRSFFVFAVAKCCMGGIVVDPEAPSIKQSVSAAAYNCGWLPLDIYLNHRPFDLRFHGINGEWLYRNEIYIRNQGDISKIVEKFINTFPVLNIRGDQKFDKYDKYDRANCFSR